jgi:hypothetical protein
MTRPSNQSSEPAPALGPKRGPRFVDRGWIPRVKFLGNSATT